ncbi:MAG: UvrD-helicase domain-containing protein [Candidatus Makana argininalis]
MNDNLFKSLNKKQMEAVSESNSNLLVLAGAGSGKTNVLINKIVWFIKINKYPPASIMAVTFTNKAAEEMKSRLKKIIGEKEKKIWIGTFHGLSNRMLRNHYKDANLPKNYQILDNEDQIRLIKRLIISMKLDDKIWNPRKLLLYINNNKDKGIRPCLENNNKNYYKKIEQNIYKQYQQSCDKLGLVDFSELLIRCYEMFIKKPYIINKYHNRFKNILVDEFQDTNIIQYYWIKILKNVNCNLIIVGDDDQSIYGWRGAKIENIYKFLEDYPNTKTIRLEQNYRCTNNILKAANSLISNNNFRLGKTLWTKCKLGDPINIYSASNEIDEANFVVNKIKIAKNKKTSLKEFAILYRSNAQSRILEETLININIPYLIYGGIRFFERSEIKHTLSYLRLILNRNDNVAYERIINIPNRGIGEKTLNIIKKTAKILNINLWKSSCYLIEKNILKKNTNKSVLNFINLINKLSKEIHNLPIHIQTDLVIKNSGLWNMYKKEKNIKNYAKLENLSELMNATKQYNDIHGISENSMQDFISNATLDAINFKNYKKTEAVTLMTIHSSKGLEFKQIFIIGMEEGIFPNKISTNSIEQLEEERRLAYVGITRTIKKLTITYAKKRKIYGKEKKRKPSRFIKEIPSSCINNINLNYNFKKNTHYKKKFRIGKKVKHNKFGYGIIIKIIIIDNNKIIKVRFNNNIIKFFTLDYNNFEIIN